MPDAQGKQVSYAFDEGRAAERMLIAAEMIDLGAGIAWIRSDIRAAVGEIFGLPPDRFIRTIVVLGHPTEAARRPKSDGRQRPPAARGDGLRGSLAEGLVSAVRGAGDRGTTPR